MKPNLRKILINMSKWCIYGIVIQMSVYTMALAHSTEAQNKSVNDIKVTLDLTAPSNLEDVLESIESSTDFHFSFRDNQLKSSSYELNLKSQKTSLGKLLLNICMQTDLSFRRINDNIYIVKKEEGIERIIESINAVITGRVTDENGDPLPGATVLEKGTSNGTITDTDGKFSLNVEDNATLLISFVGYSQQEVSVAGRSDIQVTLEPDLENLEEIVVVGYGSTKRKDITGALASVSAEQIEEMPVQNVTQALQGRAAGVDIVNNGFVPGDEPRIRIRGNRSVNANNAPLYVLDGIPLAAGTGINSINPMDIASVEILKDASATAIYGSRGANGVVLITTKKGTAGQSNISYSGYVSIDSPLRELDMMDGAEYMAYWREAHRTNGTYKRNPADSDVLGYADPIADYNLLGYKDASMWNVIADGYEWQDRANRVPATDGSGLPIYNPSNINTTDWRDMVTQTGVTQNHQVSLSKGTESLRSLFSVGYFDQKGIQKEQEFKRGSFRANLDFDLNDFITVGANTMVSLSLQDYGSDLYGKASGQLPVAVPYDSNGDFIRYPGGDDLIKNPLMDASLITDERRTVRFVGSYYLQVGLMKGLRYRMNFGPDYQQYRRGEFQSANSSARDGGTSWGRTTQNERFSYTLENLLFYDKELGQHSFGLTFLQSIQKQKFEETSITASDLPYDSQKFYALNTTNNGTPDGFSGDFNENQLMSWMARVNYSFRDRYLLTLTGRYDGASVLAEGHKWDFFPAAALGWKLHEESFLNGTAALSELKLRASYGVTGNSAVSPYQTKGTLNQTIYVFGETPAKGFSPGRVSSPELGWEKTATTNIGLDFGLFKYRVSGSVEYYVSNTTDLLFLRQLPGASGYTDVWDNFGDVRNQGVEISLNTVNVNTPRGFRWETDFVFTKNVEEIVSVQGKKEDILGARNFIIGQPINTYYDYKFDGIRQVDDEQGVAGTVKVVDTDGIDGITADDRTVLGSAVPDWTGGFTNRISYGGLELSFFVYARMGYMIANRGLIPTLDGRYPIRDINYWTPNNPSNEYPRPDANTQFPAYGEALGYEEGSFAKVRYITLSYDLPDNLVSRLSGKNINVYVTAQNPFLFTDFEVLDPESVGNVDADSFDDQWRSGRSALSTRSFVAGVKLNF